MAKPAYMVISIDIKDPDRFTDYAAGTNPLLAEHDARVLAATDRMVVEDGRWGRPRVVVIEFPSVAGAKQFWASSEYRPMKRLREEVSEADIILLEGNFDERAPGDAECYFLLGASTPTDSAWVEEYMQKVPPVAARFGVQAIASGDQFEVLDGTWSHESMVLLRFGSQQGFQDFWYGDAYRPMKELREAHTTGDHISFPGVWENYS